MAKPVTAHVLNTAASQADRLAAAPAPETVAIDGRSLAQLFAFGARYGKLIKFIDLENQWAGDWEAFFASDPVVAHSLHAALDLPEIETMLRGLLAEVRDALDGGDAATPLERILTVLGRLVGILDREPLSGTEGEDILKRLRKHERGDSLAHPMRRLHRHMGEGSIADAIGGGGGASDWADGIGDILDDFIATLLSALEKGVGSARDALDLALESGGHRPQASVFNAFVMLFDRARAEMNRIPRHFVDFYYHKILEQEAREAVPDRLFLTFERDKGVSQASVPRGSLFPAGEDAQGQPIYYAAVNSLEVTPAVVKEISVHRVAEPVHTPLHATATTELAVTGPTPPLPASGGVFSGIVALDPDKPDAIEPFPLFGQSSAGTFGSLKMQRATLGFCISSSVLQMVGGKRRVEIGLTISHRRGAAHGAPDPSGVDLDFALLASAAVDALELFYSTAGGWIAVEGVEVAPSLLLGPGGPTIFIIAFDLPPDAPPLVPLATKPAPEAPKPTLPADSFSTQPQEAAVMAGLKVDKTSDPATFNVLASLEFDQVFLDVTVEGLDALSIVTPNGQADTTQNFALFGLPPAQHAAVDLYAPELFCKPLTSLSIDIDWASPPVTSTGFEGYYRGYKLDADGNVSSTPLFDNMRFRVGFEVVNPGYWCVDESTHPWLFQTSPPPVPTGSRAIAPPAPAAAAPVMRSSLLVVPGVMPDSVPVYYNPAKSALRMTLTDPSYAFGDMLFSSNLMAASQAMAAQAAARDKHRRGSSEPAEVAPVLPNPPWLPNASGLTVSYTASIEAPISASAKAESSASTPPAASGMPAASLALEFLHLGPFNRVKPPQFDAGAADSTGLLPEIEGAAALYIQLSEPVSQVSLLFILSAGSSGWWSHPPRLVWEERYQGKWVPVTEFNDGTEGLRESGIVTLKLRSAEGDSKPPRIRVQAIGNTDNAPIVEAVIANALVAQWTPPGGAAGLGTPLPASTITKSKDKLAGVASIDQPMESFGGAPPAKGKAFEAWMAERLRHKGFAIDAWDYARLALETVPSLWQAAVIPAVDCTTGLRAPGQVWVVAVAGPHTPNVTDKTMPQVNLATLSEIGDRLTACSSAFADVHVTNPEYMPLTVFAEVEFNEDDTGAFWSQQLNGELVRWLSPWPDPALGVRPADYYSRRAIAEFIRHRSYVLGITSLHISPVIRPDPDGQGPNFLYLTSAASHRIRAVESGGMGRATELAVITLDAS